MLILEINSRLVVHDSIIEGFLAVVDGMLYLVLDGYTYVTKAAIAFCLVIFLGLHGSTQWYNYVYSENELNRFLIKIKKARTKKKSIYLNNDHGMLQNGLYLLEHI